MLPPFITFSAILTLFSLINLASGIFDPSSMSSTQGIVFTGVSGETAFGSSVSNAGDINGDGVDDILIGNPNYKSNKGVVYVVYGGNDLSNFSFDEDMNSSKGFKIEGSAAGDNLGTSIKGLGDINGDGVNDFFIVAPGAYSSYGVVYVIYGSKSKQSNMDLSTGLSLSRGFTIRITSGNSIISFVVNTVGDVNGDGIQDLIFGLPGYRVSSDLRTYRGMVFVIYGSGKNSPNITITESIDPSQGFFIRGSNNTVYFGLSVRTAGDINDDGIDDIIIGGIDIIGRTYVLYGSKEKPGSVDLNNGLGVTRGFVITLETTSLNYFGFSASYAGDLNNDGIADVAIGAPLENTYGSVYIIYGKKGGYLNISLTDSSVLSSVTTMSSSDCFMAGVIVSGAGDLNNDGIDDLYILCNNDTETPPTANAAVIFVIYGSSSGKIPDLSLSASMEETQGRLITSDPISLWLEQRFSSGDFNNDNLPDILLGSPLVDNNIGKSFIIFGENGCQKNCSKCSSSTVCLECFEGLGLYKSQCMTCPKGTSLYENNCIDCPEGCAECISPTQCKSCLKNYVLLSSQRCVSDSKSSQANITGAALDSVSVIGNTVAGGTSLPTNFGLVAKILRNIRYMNISVSSDLEETFYTWKISSGFISMPESWGDYAEPEVLPEVFQRYNLGNLFLVNYWKSLVMILIGLSLYIVFRIINFCLLKKNKTHKVGLVFRSLDVAASNFTLTQVYGSLDDVVFFFILQTRSADFRIDFGRASFALSVVLLLLGFSILGIHIVILRRYPRSNLKKEKSESEAQRFKTFFEKHENFKMFFQDFKDTNLMKQSFLLIYVGRSIISNIFITTMFEYPLLQTLLLTGLNILILVYLMVCRPFKEIFNAAGQYFCEVLLLVVNVSMLGMGIIGNLAENHEIAVERFSKIVIIMNMTLVVGSLVFMVLSIGKILYIVYKEKKAQKKKTLIEKNSIKIIPNARLTAINNVSLDQSICDPLNLSRGPSFLENSLAEYHLNANSRGNNSNGSTNLGVPSQNLFENSCGLGDLGLPNTRKISMRSPQLHMNHNYSGFSHMKITHVNQREESFGIPDMVSNFDADPRNMRQEENSRMASPQLEFRKLSENQSIIGNEGNLQEEISLFQERKVERNRFGRRKIRILSDEIIWFVNFIL